MVLELITYLLLGAYALIMLAYCWGWHRALATSVAKGKDVENQFHTLSVIVPARNEADHIESCLQSLFHQDLAKNLYEVIVVNDGSTDETAALARKWIGGAVNIQVIDLKPREGTAFKKYAIEQGIETAKLGSIMVCTDADCVHHPKWLSSILQEFNRGKIHFLAAPVVYHTQPNLLSVFQTLDFMTLQGITAASVSMGWHSMCNGANLAYTRKAFNKVNGFAGIDKLPTGDDMLLMHKIETTFPNGTSYLCNHQAMVYTHPVDTWKGFFMQRIRWASKAAFYQDKRIFAVLFLVFILNFWLFLLGLLALANLATWKLLAYSLTIKTLLELFFLIPVAKFYKKRNLLIWFPFLQPLHIAYTLISAVLGRFSSYEWKGRRIEKPSSL